MFVQVTVEDLFVQFLPNPDRLLFEFHPEQITFIGQGDRHKFAHPLTQPNPVGSSQGRWRR